MIRKVVAAVSAAMLPGAMASGAGAYPVPPGLVNQNFTDYTGSNPKGVFRLCRSRGLDGRRRPHLHRRPDPRTDASSSTYPQTYADTVRQSDL
jgi:hypothetical protein